MSSVRAIRFAAVILTAAFAAGCEEPTTLAIEIADYTLDRQDQVRVVFEEDDVIRDLVRSDFAPIPWRASSDVGPYLVDDDGVANLRVELSRRLDFSRENETVRIAFGTLDLPLESEEDFRVTIFRSVTNPISMCRDCTQSMSFPIAPAYQREPGEALWLTW